GHETCDLGIVAGFSEDALWNASCHAVRDRRERTTMTPFRLGLALMSALLTLAGSAQAQNYPNRTITMVVPFPPGGLTDVPARVFAGLLQQKIGQNVVVEN